MAGEVTPSGVLKSSLMAIQYPPPKLSRSIKCWAPTVCRLTDVRVWSRRCFHEFGSEISTQRPDPSHDNWVIAPWSGHRHYAGDSGRAGHTGRGPAPLGSPSEHWERAKACQKWAVEGGPEKTLSYVVTTGRGLDPLPLPPPTATAAPTFLNDRSRSPFCTGLKTCAHFFASNSFSEFFLSLPVWH